MNTPARTPRAAARHTAFAGLAALALIAASALAAPTPAPPSAPTIEQWVAEATAAKARGDFGAMAAALEGSLRLRPDHPRWSYHLAVARTRSGDIPAALALLERIAAQGIAYQPETDKDLVALMNATAFAAITARFAANRVAVGAARPAFGDLRVLADGALLVSDQQGGALYLLPRAGREFSRLTVPGALRSPQGVVVDDDGRHAWVADWSLGLMRVDLASGAVTRAAVASTVCAYGIDGLYRHGGDLIAVQNGIRPNRVIRLKLDGARVVGHELLVANDPRFSEPTLGTVLGDQFLFVANSQWDRFDEANALPPVAELAEPVVLEISLR